MNPRIDWPSNVIMGVSIGRAEHIHRADHLRQTGAKTKLISAEPLLESLAGLDLSGIDWLIAGGESQSDCRPGPEGLTEENGGLSWVRELREKCGRAGTAFFLKQLGGDPDPHKDQEAILDGERWRQFPRACWKHLAPSSTRQVMTLRQYHGIGWDEATWNPVWGCSRVSDECSRCYAEIRAGQMAGPWHLDPVTLEPLEQPPAKRKARASPALPLSPEAPRGRGVEPGTGPR